MRGEEKERNTEKLSKSQMFCRQSDDGQTDKKVVRKQVDEKNKTRQKTTSTDTRKDGMTNRLGNAFMNG